MAYKDQWNLASDDEFKRRAQVAICSAAIAIQAEAPATPNHPNRANYAKLVLNSPDSYMPLFALAICAVDPALTPASPDATIQTNVNAVLERARGDVLKADGFRRQIELQAGSCRRNA